MINIEERYRCYLDGDDSAFDDVLNELKNPLMLFINRYVGNPTVAEDLSIDTFMELVVHKKKYNFKTKLKTYLFTIGRNKAIDYLRHQNRLIAGSIDDNEGEEIKSLEDSVIDSERNRALYRAMNDLSKDMYNAVYLFYIEGLSYKECAKVLKKSEKQIDNLLYRSKAILRKKLEKEDITI